jgi:hypothetical protein
MEGLTANINKTKYLHCTRITIQPIQINIGGEELEQVNSFKYEYLGAMVIPSGRRSKKE